MTSPDFDFAVMWPMVVVVALTFASGFRLITLRMRALRSRTVKLSFYKTYRAGEEPENIAAATRHYTNLYETPVLFYLACLFAGLLGPVSGFALFCAWAFAVLRVTQSAIHLTSNNVRWRAYSFFTSVVFLIALWVSNIWTLSSL